MIGLFDSGFGGLTILRALSARFPHVRFMYLGDHAHVPYGNRPSDEILALTEAGCDKLFGHGCRLVILACNTATAVAGRSLQQHWLPRSDWPVLGPDRRNVLGIIAPTVEAATQTPWAVTTPQYPQKYNRDVVAVFATRRTVASDVYRIEIAKRCPAVTVIQQPCPNLAGAIEHGASEAELDDLVAQYVAEMLAETQGTPPHRAILGCTHYPLVEHLFRRHLPPFTRLLDQPSIVADSLEDYLHRHPNFMGEPELQRPNPVLLTTGLLAAVNESLATFWPNPQQFQRAAL